MKLTRHQRASLAGAAASREWMRRHGKNPSGHALWSEAEVDLLRLHYPDYTRLVELLPHRTRKAIEMKVAKLGLARPLRIWSDGEVRNFKPPYQDGALVADILPLLNEKSATQLYGAASRRRVRRPRRRPKILGVAILDSIRQRAFDMHISLSDLDEATGQKDYFSHPTSLRWSAIRKAIRVLGGQPVVHWYEP